MPPSPTNPGFLKQNLKICRPTSYLISGENEGLQEGPALNVSTHFVNFVAAKVEPLQGGQTEDTLGNLYRHKG